MELLTGRTNHLVLLPTLHPESDEGCGMLAHVSGIDAYEERQFYHVWTLGRVPDARLVIITSMPRSPMLDHAVHTAASLLPPTTKDPVAHVRSRLTVVSVRCPPSVPLADAVLARPDTVTAVRRAVAGVPATALAVVNPVSSAEALAARLGVVYTGSPQHTAWLGTKSGSRRVFAEAGVCMAPGTPLTRSLPDLAAALVAAWRPLPRPRPVTAVVKLDIGFTGAGNTVVDVTDVATALDADADAAVDGVAADALRSGLPPAFAAAVPRVGALAEVWVADAAASPSAQVFISPRGDVTLMGTHDQTMDAATGMAFTGSTFPADARYRTDVGKAVVAISRRVAAHGGVGWLSVDFVVVPPARRDTAWRVLALEVNLRPGATTHSLMALHTLAAPGGLDAASGEFRLRGRPRVYVASDSWVVDGLHALPPAALARAFGAGQPLHALAFDTATATGAVLHMVSTAATVGKFSASFVAETHQDARRLQRSTLAAVADLIAAASRALVPAPLTPSPLSSSSLSASLPPPPPPVVQAWRTAIGDANVRTDAASLAGVQADMARFPQPPIVAVLTPQSVADVEAIVAANAAQPTVTPLFPYATGKNWGLGSRTPRAAGCALVDTSVLAAIRSFDTDTGAVVIEPGVTMAMLADATAGSRWMVNVTASCAHTSVIGNALDRGVGFQRQRTDDVMGLEVVLADATRVRMGAFWHVMDAPTNRFHYKHSVGMNPVHLFYQSGCGIVTAAVVQLVPRPECTVLVEAAFDGSDSEPAVNAVRQLYHHGLMSTVAKLYDESALKNYSVDEDSDATASTAARFRLLGCLAGPAATMPATCDAVQAVFTAAGVFQDVALHHREPTHDPGLQEAYQRFTGRPTCGHKRAFGPSCDLDATAGAGWLFFLPVVPFTARDMSAALRLLTDVADDTGVAIGATLNVLSPTCVDLVTSIKWVPSPAADAAAHKALDMLHTRFRAAGYYSYREDVHHQSMGGDPAFLGVVRRLKATLDPRNMMSPGRYSPGPPPDGAAGSATPSTPCWPSTYEEWMAGAKAVLHPLLFDYYSYTAGGDVCDPNRAVLDALPLRTRCLTGVGDPGSVNTRCTVFGQVLGMPVIVAPTAFHGFMHASAEVGTASGASDAGAGYAVNGFLSNRPLADIQAASAAPTANWLHVYLWKERELVARLLRDAEALGFSAVVVTADHPTTHITDVYLPKFTAAAGELPDVRLPNLDPAWEPGQPLAATNDGTLSWSDVTWLAEATRLPVVVKGVLCADDAVAAVTAGAAGVVVSNHGQRQVRGGRPAMAALPEVVAAVARVAARTRTPPVPVFVDSGIRTGGDVLRAVALGATAVMVGRPVLWGLAVGGGDGVAAVLNTMRGELASDMAHVGVTRVADLGPHVLASHPVSRL